MYGDISVEKDRRPGTIRDAISTMAYVVRATMKPRTAERFLLRSRVSFSGIGIEIKGEGMFSDLSKTGCRVESDTRPPKGTELKLELFLSDYAWPLKIDRAVVCWTKGRAFGLELVSLQSAQRDRLTRMIMKLKQDVGH
jgi:hypothetical protein